MDTVYSNIYEAIGSQIQDIKDLSSFSRTSKKIFNALSPKLEKIKNMSIDHTVDFELEVNSIDNEGLVSKGTITIPFKRSGIIDGDIKIQTDNRQSINISCKNGNVKDTKIQNVSIISQNELITYISIDDIYYLKLDVPGHLTGVEKHFCVIDGNNSRITRNLCKGKTEGYLVTEVLSDEVEIKSFIDSGFVELSTMIIRDDNIFGIDRYNFKNSRYEFNVEDVKVAIVRYSKTEFKGECLLGLDRYSFEIVIDPVNGLENMFCQNLFVIQLLRDKIGYITLFESVSQKINSLI